VTRLGIVRVVARPLVVPQFDESGNSKARARASSEVFALKEGCQYWSSEDGHDELITYRSSQVIHRLVED
jgi:hypothetical protein